MKALKVSLISLLVLLVLAAGALFFIPRLYKTKIIEMAKTEANKQLNARLNFNNDIEISLFRSFPRLHITFNDLSIVGVDSFKNDTLLWAPKMSMSADAWHFYKTGELNIFNIKATSPSILLKVLENGNANWDIVKASDPNDTSTFHAKMEMLNIENAQLVYNDKSLAFYASLDHIYHNSSGDFTADVFDLNTHTEGKNLYVTYEGVPLLSGADALADAVINANIEKDIYTFKQNSFMINDLPLTFNGVFSFDQDDNTIMDFTVEAQKNEVKNFMSIIPAIYENHYKDLKSEGVLTLNGFMKGKYSDSTFPAYGLKAIIEKGKLQYPGMPLPLQNIAMKLNIENKDGVDDHTVIDISNMNFELGKDPVFLKLLVQNPYTDPLIDADIKGVINLDNISKFIPFEQKTVLNGILTANLEAKGRKSAFVNQQINNFTASGIINASNLKYKTPSMPQLLEVSKANMQFSNTTVTITDLAGKLSKNDIALNCNFSNFYGYSLGSQVLQGKVQLTSDYFNLNDFVNGSTDTTAPLKVIEVPGNVDLQLNSKFGELVYGKYRLNNMTGIATVANHQLLVEQLSTAMFGGLVNLKGKYSTADISNPLVDMKLSLSEIDIPSIFGSFDFVKTLAPVAAYSAGKFSADFNFSAPLNQSMSPVLGKLSCGGLLDLITVKVEGSNTLKSIANQLNNNKLSSLDLKNKLLKFNISDGKILVEPFDIALGDGNLQLSGFTLLDQTLSYTGMLSLPKSMLGNQQVFYDKFQKNTSFAGISLAPQDVINLALAVTGTFKKPEVKLMLKEIKQKVVGQVKDAAREVVDKQKEAAEQRARDEMEKARQEAEKAAKEAEEKARQAAEAEKERIRAELEKAAAEQRKKIEEEARKKIKDALKKPPF